MFRLLKRWLRDRLFTPDEIATEEAVQVVHRGKQDEERLEFWRGMQTMLESSGGLAYQAMMQREFIRLQSELLIEPDTDKRTESLFRLRQQAFVTTYPEKVRREIKALLRGLNKE